MPRISLNTLGICTCIISLVIIGAKLQIGPVPAITAGLFGLGLSAILMGLHSMLTGEMLRRFGSRTGVMKGPYVRVRGASLAIVGLYLIGMGLLDLQNRETLDQLVDRASVQGGMLATLGLVGSLNIIAYLLRERQVGQGGCIMTAVMLYAGLGLIVCLVLTAAGVVRIVSPQTIDALLEQLLGQMRGAG